MNEGTERVTVADKDQGNSGIGERRIGTNKEVGEGETSIIKRKGEG